MNLMYILDALFILLYFIAEGATEGYTWASPTRRLSNRIIKGGRDENGFAKIDYHGWRFFETFFAFYALQRFFSIFIGLGLFLVFLFIYERVINKVVNDNYFKPNTATYKIMGKEFDRKQWHDWLALLIGIVFLFIGLR